MKVSRSTRASWTGSGDQTQSVTVLPGDLKLSE
jgi:hypothetical protein